MELQHEPGLRPTKAVNLPMYQDIRGWYTSLNAMPHVEVMQRAHEEAEEVLAKVMTKDERKQTWRGKHPSMRDVLETLDISKKKYASKPRSKARKWLSILSSRITHYGAIMDVLVQQHPEYVSLAWGAMKFLFIAIMNHEELTKQIAKAFSRTAEVLPRTELILILYPTDLMRDAVAHLYAQIIKFIQKTVTWYRRGTIAHAWGSIARPWALSFQDDFDRIKALSQRVDELASTAQKAEIRDVHREVLEMGREMQVAQREIGSLRQLFEQKTGEILRILTENRALQQRMHVDLSDQSEMIHNIQLTQILSLSFMCTLPTSGESLGYCQSIRARDSVRTSYRLPTRSIIETWSLEPRKSMLLIQNSSRQAAKSFLVDFVELIHENKYPVIWALRFPNFWDKGFTYRDLLTILVIQAIQMNPPAISGPAPITAVHLREASNEVDWLNILKRALTGIPKVYIVIDAELLSSASENSPYRATRMVEKLPEMLTGTNVKIVISMASLDQEYITRNWDPNSWSGLQIGSVGRGVTQLRRNARRQRKIRSRFSRPGVSY